MARDEPTGRVHRAGARFQAVLLRGIAAVVALVMFAGLAFLVYAGRLDGGALLLYAGVILGYLVHATQQAVR